MSEQLDRSIVAGGVAGLATALVSAVVIVKLWRPFAHAGEPTPRDRSAPDG